MVDEDNVEDDEDWRVVAVVLVGWVVSMLMLRSRW